MIYCWRAAAATTMRHTQQLQRERFSTAATTTYTHTHTHTQRTSHEVNRAELSLDIAAVLAPHVAGLAAIAGVFAAAAVKHTQTHTCAHIRAHLGSS